ncbi:fumarylacetoacetate hydrolase family protein [Shewanella atlantica]|uniref:FAA hydrolase family protein n=1 Tax=Shewanella atlantica TaxID=271099 RepID=A0A3S0KJP3_9GAMM|nr:fumarylacetoacetate hydrolase family protein [Shewanella atlantica]RTR32488.1 FAA hydrolase family protein [Shewanella atlantica]
MKLASYNNGRRDGQLMLVSKDLSKAVAVPAIAHTMQQLLDAWDLLQPQLQELYEALNDGLIDSAIDFDEAQCLSPLPRAYQWADGSAYVNHVELVRKARGAQMPETFWTDPLVYQGGSDCFIAPKADIPLASEEWGIDFESEIAVITDDVPMGVTTQNAEKHIKLLMLVNDVSLRNLIPGELAKGFGFYQAKPSSSFSPVAVTPEELGARWEDSKVHLPLITHLNESLFGRPNAGVDMTFNFSQLVSHVAKTRPLGAGAIIGSGTISNYDRSAGSSCLAETRMLETIAEGKPSTSFMKFGDRVRIEMLDDDQKTIFGSIDQQVVEYKG